MSNQIVVLGSINMDQVIQVDQLPLRGETVEGKSVFYVPGGKGANVAVAASRLGADVALIGKIGNDNYGSKLFNFLKSERLNLDGLGKSSNSSGQAIITVDKNGNNTLIYVAGANSEVDENTIDDNKILIKESSLVISQYEIRLKVIGKFFQVAKSLNKKTVLNPSPACPTPDSLFKMTDYLVLNETELSTLRSKEIITSEDLIKSARAILLKGPIVVIVTLGEKGSVAVTKNEVIEIEAIKVKAVDTTAAGDCFLGAFATQINNGLSLKESLNFSNKAAALTVQKQGASSSLPYLADLQN